MRNLFFLNSIVNIAQEGFGSILDWCERQGKRGRRVLSVLLCFGFGLRFFRVVPDNLSMVLSGTNSLAKHGQFLSSNHYAHSLRFPADSRECFLD